MEIGFLMLADHAESVNGKLYMVGGGWNVLRFPELPHDWGFHIALGLDVGWSETNQPHNLRVVIHDRTGSSSARASPPTSRPAARLACPPARTSAW